jgi:hypothetical protein
MSIYYARNVTGNWASNTSWDTVSSGGAGPAGPPIAGDTAIFDADFDAGNITVAATAACTTLTVQAGATGTLTFSASYQLIVAGNVTFVTGFNIGLSSVTSGGLTISTTATLTSAGLTLPNLLLSGSATYTLVGDLTVSGLFYPSNSTPILAGAYNIACGTFTRGSANGTLTLVSGQTLTVSTTINIGGLFFTPTTIKSSTPSSDAFIQYDGTAANRKVYGTTFTDINFTSDILNWYGGTLTRCKNHIFTVSSANATVGATYTNNGVTFTVDITISGGTTLTCTSSVGTPPAASGTLTKASGTGDATITFSSYTRQGILNVDADNIAYQADASKIVSGQTVGEIPGSAAGGGGIWMPRARQIGV